MQKSLTIASAQTSLANAMHLQTIAGEAKCLPSSPDLLIFPEGFLTGYYVADAAQVALTATVADETLSQTARINEMALVAGYIERDATALYNAAMVVDEQGNRIASYRKRCLYGDWERKTFAPGDKACLFHYKDWCIGLIICYDVEFPEITRELAMMGAEIIIAPTALMEPDEELVFALLPARAIENGVCIIYANRTGKERELRYVGGSRIINPRGEILAQAKRHEETIIQATITKPVNAPRSEYLTDIVRLSQ